MFKKYAKRSEYMLSYTSDYTWKQRQWKTAKVKKKY